MTKRRDEAHGAAADPAPEGEDRLELLKRRLVEIEGENERLEQERDRAISARDVVIREALVGPSPKDSGSKAGRPRWFMMLLLLALLVSVGLVVLRMVRTSAVLGRRADSAAPGGAKKGSGASSVKRIVDSDLARKRGSRALRGDRRVSVLPIHELAAVGRIALSRSRVALAGGGGKIALFDLARDRMAWVVEAHSGPVRDLVFVKGGRQLASGGEDGAVVLWGVRAGRKLRTIRAVGGSPVRRLASSSAALAVAAGQPRVELYPLQKAAPVRRLTGHGGPVSAVAFSPSGSLLATAGHDRLIRLWVPGEAKVISTLSGHRSWINALAFSPSGKILVSGGLHREAILWDVEAGKLAHRLSGHVRGIIDVAFSRRGALVATASLDRTARLWSVGSGRLHGRLVGHAYQVTSVRFSAGGSFVLTASGDGTLRLWPRPLPVSRGQAMLPPPGPGEVTLRHNTSGNRVRLKLIGRDGEVLKRGQSGISRFWRSPDGESTEPDAALLKLLFSVADHFGRKREIVVVSGYRSPRYNALRAGHSKQVGRESLHTRGQAMDFRIEGVTITALHRHLLKLRAGGVGMYPDSRFVHMDVGPIRRWQGD